DKVRKALDKHPDDIYLRDEEAVYVQAFSDAKLDEERFLNQKAKVDCGVEVTGPAVLEVFVSHYELFLGSSMQCEDLDITDLVLNRVTNASNDYIVRDISNDEIKATMFDIGDDRASGPDGGGERESIGFCFEEKDFG
nr:hypothetical protein [Tanacetum cinerariifolium]